MHGLSRIRRSCCLVLAAAGLSQGVAPLPSRASSQSVDVELVVAVDVSLSMSEEELVIQRDGYVAAITHPTVMQAIRGGLHGRIAVTYVEWAGEKSQHIVVPWTVIASAADAANFAEQISTAPFHSARRTSISAAIDFSVALFPLSGVRGTKRVIDLSGDGPNNQGPPVEQARNRALDAGITVNGLPLMTSNGPGSTAYDIHNLDGYYSKCVIGGPGAFMIPVNSWAHFPEAVRRKLVLELAGPASPAWGREEAMYRDITLAVGVRGVDCLVGEKTWGEPLPPVH